jgi:hypothetical protein
VKLGGLKIFLYTWRCSDIVNEYLVKCYLRNVHLPLTAAFELYMVGRYLLRPKSVSTYPSLRHWVTVSSKNCFTPDAEMLDYSIGHRIALIHYEAGQ